MRNRAFAYVGWLSLLAVLSPQAQTRALQMQPRASAWPGGQPPLYRRIPEAPLTAGAGVSMIDAVGDTQHPPQPVEHGSGRRLTLGEACAVVPNAEQMRSFAVFAWMSAEQAAALGVVFRGVQEGAGTQALVWRTGRLAECTSASGRALLYGSEWDLAVLVRAGVNTGAASEATLRERAQAGDLRGVGASGEEDVTSLAAQLAPKTTGRSTQQFLRDFAKAQAQTTTAAATQPSRAIGYR